VPGIRNSVDPTSMGDPAIQNAERTSYNAQMGLLQPGMDQQSKGLEDQLAAEGITQGSDNYDTAKANLERTQGQIQAGVAGNAVQQGIGLQNQLFGQDLSNAGFNNQAAAQQLSQDFGIYNQPLNTLNAFQSGSQVSMPQFQATNPVNMAGTNTSGNVWNAYQGNVNNANSQNAASNALWSGIASLGGTLGGAAIISDPRLKKDILRVGTHSSGLPIYSFRYLWEDGHGEEHLGFMADEVKEYKPDAVVTAADGFDRVDYGMLM